MRNKCDAKQFTYSTLHPLHNWYFIMPRGILENCIPYAEAENNLASAVSMDASTVEIMGFRMLATIIL